jgi:hypothetical protein
MKKLLFTLAIGLATLTSCESDLVSAPPSDSIDGVSSIGDGVLLRKDIISNADGTVNNTSDFTYEGNKVIKIVNVSEFGTETTIYTYTDNLLTRIDDEHVNPSGAISSEVNLIEYDSNNKINKETTTLSDGSVQVNTYVHNTNGTVTLNEDGGAIYIYTYSNGNIVSENHTNGDNDYVSVFDDQNGFFKNVHQRDVFELIGNYTFKNNLLSYTNTGGATYPDNETYTYTYNSEGYPVTSIGVYAPGTVGAETTTTEYFYE